MLDTRPGPSARGGALGRLAGDPPATVGEGRALVDRAVGPGGGRPRPHPRPRPTTPRPRPSTRPPSPTSPAAWRAPWWPPPATWPPPSTAPSPPKATPCPGPTPTSSRLAALDAELGPGRSEEVRPRFDHRRHVRFASAWAAARWDLVACYHDALAGRLDAAAIAAEVDRLAAFGDDPALADVARWLAGRASAAGRPDVAAALAAVTPGRRTPLPVPATRPTVEVTATGELVPGEAPDPSRATACRRRRTRPPPPRGARHRGQPGIDRGRGRPPPAAGWGDGGRGHVDRHPRSAPVVPRPLPAGVSPRRRAARGARQPGRLRRHRRPRGLARTARGGPAGPARPAPRHARTDHRRPLRRRPHRGRPHRGRRRRRRPPSASSSSASSASSRAWPAWPPAGAGQSR